MARSTKLDRLITDPLNTRLTTAEAKVATIETRGLVELGDNISGLANDVGYQNATQVEAKIQAVVGVAPAALDTLGEIATALADDDDAIATLVAQDTANASAITTLQDSLAELDASDIPVVGFNSVNYSLDTGEEILPSTILNHLRLADQFVAGIHANTQAQIADLNFFKASVGLEGAGVRFAVDDPESGASSFLVKEIFCDSTLNQSFTVFPSGDRRLDLSVNPSVTNTLSTLISAIEAVNTDQDTAIEDLEAKTHDALTIAPTTKGLALSGQELALKLDPSPSNVLVDATTGLLVNLNTVKYQLQNPTLQAVTTGVEIFIDNVNGSDATANPTVNATPCKTFATALQFVRDNYYFTDAANNYLTFTLISDYNFSFQESAIFDGSLITGSVSLILKSNNITPKLITATAKQPIVFKNFSYELKLETINFSSLSVVQINFISRVYVTSVSFYKLTVRICELFYDLTTGSTFNGLTTFTNVDDVRFLATSIIKNIIKVAKADNVYFGGQIQQGNFDLQQVSYCLLLTNSSISESTLSTAGNIIFNFRDINDVNLNATLILNSTTGVNLRRFFNLTHVNQVRASTTNLVLVNMYSSPIVHKTSALIKLIHSEATTLNISAGTGFKPVFIEENSTRKLLDLEFSAYSVGVASTPESTLNTDIFSTTSRLVVFDKLSQFFEENLLDLRGRITRRTITADITLRASDTSRQHLINQSGADRNVGLPSSAVIDQEFEVINNSTSTFNLIFAGETVVPGTRHAVQWDATEWVVM